MWDGALNPPSSFVSYAEALRREGFSRIVVVNDGSRTDKLPVFFKLKRLGVKENVKYPIPDDEEETYLPETQPRPEGGTSPIPSEGGVIE